MRPTLRAMTPATRFVWVETPSNPFLKIVDIAAAAEIAHAAGARCVVDNTFASPYLQRPLELGADVVLHSVTKYLGGHSDLIGGAIVTSDEALVERLTFLQNAAGAVPGPMDCYLAIRGVKTLAVRMQAHHVFVFKTTREDSIAPARSICSQVARGERPAVAR